MKGIKSWIKGMNQDGTQSKEDQSTYYYAKDWRVITDEGKSTGSLENEKGTKLAFNVPNLTQMTLTDGTIIPAQNNLRIIGWGTIVDTIVIFTTSEDSLSPLNSYGQIWKLTFDEATETIIGLSSNNLTIANHLVYNQKLNFTTNHRIGRVVGRYESNEIQRVYWTDFYNSVRVFNIAEPNSLDVPLDNISLAPGINFAQAIVQSVGSGNLQTGAQIQFSYRLIDNTGGETLLAPLSAMYPLTGASPYGSYNSFVGDNNGKTRSATYTLTEIDTSYTTIQHIAVLYTGLNTYKIYKFAEEQVPVTGNMTVTCSDLDSATELTNVEFNSLSSGFDIAKDIEVKDNKLIAANTITENFDIEFDARAYRFNSSRIALIKDSNLGDITIDGVTKLILTGPGAGTSWTNIDPKHDAINVYNDESDPNWFTSQYKYQSDGTTLGGEGPNVKYTFITHSIPGNFINNVSTGPPHVSVGNSPSDYPMNGQLNGDGSTYIIEDSGQIENNAGAYNEAYFRGYARGEVYRKGLIFWSRRGSTSFAEWIADIRFPDVEDGYPLMDEQFSSPYLYTLGIKYTVDINTLGSKELVKGFSVVKVRREDSDKTKLGSGMLMYFDIQDDSYENSIIHRYEQFIDGTGGANNPYQLTDDTVVFSNTENSNYHLADKPGFLDPQIANSDAKRVAYILSPMGQLYGVTFKDGDFLKTTGYYTAKCGKYYMDISGTDDDKAYGFEYKLRDYQAPTHAREWFQIGNQEIMQVGQYYYSGSSLTNGYTAPNNLMNASYCRDFGPRKETPLGLGSPKMAVMLTATPSIQHNSGDPGTNLTWNGGGDYRGLSFQVGNISDEVLFKEVYYCRYVTNQYGGNTFEDRSKSVYVSTNHFQTLNNNLNGITNKIYSPDVWGGDVFVNYYDDEQIQMFVNQSTAYSSPYDPPVPNKLSVAVCFPTESPCNADYREGTTWAANKSALSMLAYEGNDYIYNPIWSQENIAESKYFSRDFLIRFTEEHPHQLWASDNKIDGELIDSWRIFRTANRTEVNGIYGPINRIINYRDRLYFYQDMAFGIASIDERSVITDQSGQELVLGIGGVFPDYQYISTLTGSYHQFCIVPTENALYHYDARLKKVFKYTGGPNPISDVKGMSSWFANNITGDITKNDHTLRVINGGPVGVHAEADYRYNRVLFTFLKGDNEKYTISYNEMLDAFESFYTYTPSLYLQYGRRLLSVNPGTKSEAYTHNIGDFGVFYNNTPSTCIIKTILGDNGNVTKTIDNLEYLSEVYNSSKLDIYNETINRLRIRNEYQDTGLITLTNNINIKRRMRHWRTYIPRDSSDGKSRIRNPWAELTLEYDNNANKRFVLHDLIYSYTPSPL